MSEVTSGKDRGVTVNVGERERRAFVQQVRRENDGHFGPPARKMVETMLAAGHPHPWAYVYELSQNAIDAGARRIYWRTNGGSLLFQHDGDAALDEPAVDGLSSIGASTKGQDAIGFMGVGFKSVFNRFRTARISGFGWRIRFDIGKRHGALGATVSDWFDALQPHWDRERLDPDAGYTTAFHLTRPVAPAARLADDLARLASPDDPTPLSVLALRGLEQVCIDDVTWDLSVRDGVVEVRRAPDGLSRRWRFFVSCYRPDDAAMRRFLEARQDLTYQEASGSERPKRSVVALVPLDEDGLPNPPSQGRVYATLPTRVSIPFGFHLQADWLVNLERQSLRAIRGDPWQEAIVQQVPMLVREILLWLKEESESAMSRGYRILSNPTRLEGEVSDVLGALRGDFIRLLGDLKIVPVLRPETRRFSTPRDIVRLPGRFLSEFGKRPAWRPDLLFDRDLMDEALLGSRAVQFANWLGWGLDIDPDAVEWTVTLPPWWSAVEGNTDALFALWSCVAEQEWHHAPVVPTEADGWLPADDTCWLNEEPPSVKEPSGAVVAEALAGFLPAAEQRVPPRIRALVNQHRTHPGVTWLQERHREQRLKDIVRQVCTDAGDGDAFPLVELLDWAVSRNPNRQDLVPLVMTEGGAHKPSAALLADPLVPGGEDRRRLFPSVPALVEDYALIDDQQAAVRFIERLSVRGDATLKERRVPVGYDKQAVGKLLGIEVDQIKPAALASGWTVLDYDLPFKVQTVPLDALQRWLSREHTLLAHKGTRKATSSYHGLKTTDGERASAWVHALEEHPWILCQDGQRRRPGDLLLHADPDFEDAPLARISPDLANRLKQEGVRFGADISRSPVLRRLEKRGSSNLPDADLAGLLEEALAEIEAGTVTRDELIAMLRSAVTLRGVPLDRVVREAGRPGTRSDLGGWVVALSSVEARLAAAVDRIEIELPRTTTGQQALGYLSERWRRRPDSVDEVRAHMASAYRYVLQDLERDDLDRGVWRDAKQEARLYGKGSWHEISDSLVVDDVRSPFIRQLLTANRVAISAAHLGGAPEQIRLVAAELGIACLSTKIKISRGRELPRPPWMGNLKRLVVALGTLEGRQPLSRITCRLHLALRVEGERHQVTAYLVHDELMVTGTPATFGTEAAEQLVEHFQLGQRGNSIPRLTAALGSLAEDERFSENLKVLASGLGLSVPEPTIDRPKTDTREPLPTGPVDPEPAGTTRAGPDSGREPPDDQSRRVAPKGRAIQSKKTAPDSSPAADQFAILIGRNQGRASSVSGAGGSDAVEPTKTSTPPKDDKKARAAVVKYEIRHKRPAKEMPAGQPGFDVLSDDPVTGRQRRIEVKGVKGDFAEDASVLLTARQVEDALQHTEDDVEYWLYVVDRTETDNPRVFPIPWTRNRGQLRYGFYAEMWAQCAERDPRHSDMIVRQEDVESEVR